MPQDHVSEFRTLGYAVIPGLFGREEVVALAKAFDRIKAEAMVHGRSWRHENLFYRIARDRALGPILRYAQWPAWIDETLERVRRDPRILAVLEPLIGSNLKQIINQLHWKPPGAAMADFGFHQDSRSRRPPEAYRDLSKSYIQTGIAVDPHRAENGAMVLCPGSHGLGELPFDPTRPSMDIPLDEADLPRLGIDPASKIVLELDPGDLAIWHVHTLHGSGPNHAEIDRRFYINGYVIAENCDRGEWAFRNGLPCPLSGAQNLVHYEELYTRPGPFYVD